MNEAESVVGDNDSSSIRVGRGFVADVIVTTRFEYVVAAESTRFVMKAGRVYKRRGLPSMF